VAEREGTVDLAQTVVDHATSFWVEPQRTCSRSLQPETTTQQILCCRGTVDLEVRQFLVASGPNVMITVVLPDGDSKQHGRVADVHLANDRPNSSRDDLLSHEHWINDNIRGHWVNHFGSVNDGIEDTTRNAAFEVAKDKNARGERVLLIR
jgi:hypothetical protein